MMARLYKTRGWDQYAQFNNKGGFNQPYILFKSKNMTDIQTRRLKWTKVRPIAPGTKHPMKKLLHYVGRAWSFVTARIPGDHLVINKTSEVPRFLDEARGVLRNTGFVPCLSSFVQPWAASALTPLGLRAQGVRPAAHQLGALFKLVLVRFVGTLGLRIALQGQGPCSHRSACRVARPGFGMPRSGRRFRSCRNELHSMPQSVFVFYM